MTIKRRKAMSKFNFEMFRDYYYDKSYIGFNKAKWTKEKALEQGALELEEKDLSKLEVKEGYVRHGFGKNYEDEVENGWWLDGIEEERPGILEARNKVKVWIITHKEKENE